ncbi:hypothetical protein SCUP515_00867 [Seiridium cupressi]
MSHSKTRTSMSGEIELACDQLRKGKDTVDYKLTQPDAFVAEKLDLFRLELRLAKDAWEALTVMSATEQDKDQAIAHNLEHDEDAGLHDKDCLEGMAIQLIHYGYSFGDDDFEAKFIKAALFGTMRLLKAMWSWATENIHEQSQLVRVLDEVLLSTLLS